MKIITKHIDCINVDIDYKVGTCAQENHDIIDAADAEDLWFHISGCASCHVICKLPENVKLDKKSIYKIAIQGAVICKQNSKYKSYKNVKIDYTKIKYVTKKEIPGSVIITNASSIFI
jgi:predicted ribosome quality control (RQC) complex YloA/Tae2 family protein